MAHFVLRHVHEWGLPEVAAYRGQEPLMLGSASPEVVIQVGHSGDAYTTLTGRESLPRSDERPFGAEVFIVATNNGREVRVVVDG